MVGGTRGWLRIRLTATNTLSAKFLNVNQSTNSPSVEPEPCPTSRQPFSSITAVSVAVCQYSLSEKDEV